jgi:hypothetical protein
VRRSIFEATYLAGSVPMLNVEPHWSLRMRVATEIAFRFASTPTPIISRAQSAHRRELNMRFEPEERSALLSVKGVGPKVVERLEQMGFASLVQLADADATDILAQGAALTGSSCWKNSPQAKAAIQAAIAAAIADTP